jgi:cell wall-associated NlpC family hydrolase
VVDNSLTKLIGIPYRDEGRGPDFYDCYGLIKHLYQNQLNVDIPDYRSPEDRRLVSAIFRSELRLWAPCEKQFGAVALLRVPGMFHCGFMLNNNDFIHTWEHSGGVCIEQLSDWSARLVGVYKYVGK